MNQWRQEWGRVAEEREGKGRKKEIGQKEWIDPDGGSNATVRMVLKRRRRRQLEEISISLLFLVYLNVCMLWLSTRINSMHFVLPALSCKLRNQIETFVKIHNIPWLRAIISEAISI